MASKHNARPDCHDLQSYSMEHLLAKVACSGIRMTLDLFGGAALPSGYLHRSDAISVAEEPQFWLMSESFREFDFHGFTDKRRVGSFRWMYDFKAVRVQTTDPIPEFLQTVRKIAGAAIGRSPDNFIQVLVMECGPGAGMGGTRLKLCSTRSSASHLPLPAHCDCAAALATMESDFRLT